MKKGKVIFIDSVHDSLKNGLEEDGWQCDWLVDLNRSEIEKVIHQYDGAVIRSKFTFDKDIIDKSTKLKFIARSGSGLENIDLEYAKEKGIQIFNSPEGNRDAVGEQALGMLLTLFQKLNQADQQVRNGMWDREGNRGIELKGKTVGIIGFGQMGSALAQRLSGFECKVLAYDKYKSGYSSQFAKEVDLKTLQLHSDVISFHVPLNEETCYYLDKDFVSDCAKPFTLINTSRGKVVSTEALVSALKSGRINGACLDVLEYESSSFENTFSETPPALDFLIKANNTVLSPHVAGWTVESYEKLSSVLLVKIRASY